jgi:protein-disulfide isomerase
MPTYKSSMGTILMKSKLPLILLLCAIFAGVMGAQTGTQTPPQRQAPPASGAPNAAIQQKIESYLRHLYAWGTTFKLKVGTLRETAIPGLYQVTVDVTVESQTDSATFFVSKDGRYLLRGDLEDLNGDPLADTRKQMSLVNVPSQGPANAKVVMVEYADFECPSCKQLDTILRTLLPKYPQVRLVYKDYPLVQIHPWAMTAATAGRCAYKQNPTGFWKFHDLLFDNQDLINPENAWQKMQDYAERAGLNPESLKVCMAAPETQTEVKRSMTEGEALHINNTPTIFVNGRRLIGPDAATLEQYLRYELH